MTVVQQFLCNRSINRINLVLFYPLCSSHSANELLPKKYRVDSGEYLRMLKRLEYGARGHLSAAAVAALGQYYGIALRERPVSRTQTSGVRDVCGSFYQ